MRFFAVNYFKIGFNSSRFSCINQTKETEKGRGSEIQRVKSKNSENKLPTTEESTVSERCCCVFSAAAVLSLCLDFVFLSLFSFYFLGVFDAMKQQLDGDSSIASIEEDDDDDEKNAQHLKLNALELHQVETFQFNLPLIRLTFCETKK